MPHLLQFAQCSHQYIGLSSHGSTRTRDGVYLDGLSASRSRNRKLQTYWEDAVQRTRGRIAGDTNRGSVNGSAANIVQVELGKGVNVLKQNIGDLAIRRLARAIRSQLLPHCAASGHLQIHSCDQSLCRTDAFTASLLFNESHQNQPWEAPE